MCRRRSLAKHDGDLGGGLRCLVVVSALAPQIVRRHDTEGAGRSAYMWLRSGWVMAARCGVVDSQGRSWWVQVNVTQSEADRGRSCVAQVENRLLSAEQAFEKQATLCLGPRDGRLKVPG